MDKDQQLKNEFDVTDPDEAIKAIKQAVADGNDEILQGIIFTRELWAYDKGMYDENVRILKNRSDGSRCQKDAAKESTRAKAGQGKDEREFELQKRKFYKVVIDDFFNDVLSICKTISFATDLFNSANGQNRRKGNGSK